MSKYIIEIAKEYEEYFKGVLLCGIADGKFAVDIIAREDLEELNSDYINENYGSMQDEAYRRGLEDAWEAARKIIRMPDGDILDLFPDCYASVCTAVQAILKYDASEAIAKLKAYEEKQKAADEIKVGDEVTHKSDLATWKAVCIRIDGDRQHMNLMGYTGAVGYYPVDDFKKTGRHFNIGETLEAMRE